MFGGSSAPAEQQQADNAVASQANNDTNQSSTWGPRSCETDARTFTQCLDQNQGNMQICGWYLEQLVNTSTLFVDRASILTNLLESMPASLEGILG